MLFGGLIGGVLPLVIGYIVSLFFEGDVAAGVDWMVVGGVLRLPVTFGLGALGGALVHLIQSSRPASSADRPARAGFARAAWIVAGALAGVGAAGFTASLLRGLGPLVAFAMVPVLIWIGVVLGTRVNDHRLDGNMLAAASLGAIIVAGATSGVLALIGLAVLPRLLDIGSPVESGAWIWIARVERFAPVVAGLLSLGPLTSTPETASELPGD